MAQKPGPRFGTTIHHYHNLLNRAWENANATSDDNPKLDKNGDEVCFENAIDSLILAAAASEAFINELPSELNYHLEKQKVHRPDPVKTTTWALQQLEAARQQPLMKYEFAIYLLSGKEPSRGAQPLQNLQLLFSIRNDIMHVKSSSTIMDDSTDVKLPRSWSNLETEGLLLKLPKRGKTHWFTSLQTPRVAKWACETAQAACLFVAELIPATELRESITKSVVQAKTTQLVTVNIILPPRRTGPPRT